MLYTIIQQSIIISFAIVGLRIVSSKGMVLHFLRFPYDVITNRLKNERFSFDMQSTNDRGLEVRAIILKRIKKYNILIHLLKPIIGCCTCMASFYTIVISHYYFELSQWTILQIFIVAFLNSILFATYNKLIK